MVSLKRFGNRSAVGSESCGVEISGIFIWFFAYNKKEASPQGLVAHSTGDGSLCYCNTKKQSL